MARAAVVGLLLAAALLLGCDRSSPSRPVEATAKYVGAVVCQTCHQAQARLWQESDHARAMLSADARAVLGNFDGASFRKDGVTSTFTQRDGRYVVRTDGADGALREFPVAYTFGVRPLQQYLVELPGGRYQALGVAWDTRPAAAGGQRWFHLYPRERIDHRDVLHWTGPMQNWNFMCADCHSTDLRKNYRPDGDRFETTWSDVNVACEACHGPGSRHVEWARTAKPTGVREPARTGKPSDGLVLGAATPASWDFAPGASIAQRSTPLGSRVEVDACGRCHSRRAQIWPEYTPGQALGQSYRVAVLEPELYHADGQILDEVYEYGSFLQSRMYAAGVTCSDCHEPHSGRLRSPGRSLCARCHLPARYDAPAHHFHRAGTKAAECVSCHMAERLYMVIDARRDHGFRVPRPDLSLSVGVPNACNDCHRERTPRWAAEAVARRYGAARRSGWHWAEAIHAGRAGRADAEAQLTRATDEASVPAIARATALSLLSRYIGPGSTESVRRSLSDVDPLVRREAVAALAGLAPADRLGSALPLLRDPVRTVRLAALGSVLDVPRAALSDAQRAEIDAAIVEYRQAQASNADRAEAHVNVGALEVRLGNVDAAKAAFDTALRLQPSFIPAYLALADLQRQRSREGDAEAALRTALTRSPNDGDVREALGLSLVRQGRRREAVVELGEAAKLRPDVARYAYVHGVALWDVGESRRAIEALAEAQRRHPSDREIVFALADYSARAGNGAAARLWARKLVELSPNDTRARALLQALEGRR